MVFLFKFSQPGRGMILYDRICWSLMRSQFDLRWPAPPKRGHCLLFWECQSLSLGGDGIHRCWKSDERERERWSDEAWELTSGPPSSQLGGQWHQDYYQYQTTYAQVQKVIICDDLMAHENVFTWTSPNRKSYFTEMCTCFLCVYFVLWTKCCN